MSMRVAVFGEEPAEASRAVRAAGLRPVRVRADVMLCHGGDGTLLRAEREHPGVPKVPARVARLCRLCPAHRLERILDALARDTLATEALEKIALTFGNARHLALNDVVMRNHRVQSAVRFRVAIDGGALGDEITGDGVVFATPYGSTAYYRAITRGVVRSGIGVAFNNTTEQVEHFVVGGTERLEVTVTRGPADVVYDNCEEMTVLGDGERFAIERSDEMAIVRGLDALRCQVCVRATGEAFNPH